jgi:hypothetical protein
LIIVVLLSREVRERRGTKFFGELLGEPLQSPKRVVVVGGLQPAHVADLAPLGDVVEVAIDQIQQGKIVLSSSA